MSIGQERKRKGNQKKYMRVRGKEGKEKERDKHGNDETKVIYIK